MNDKCDESDAEAAHSREEPSTWLALSACLGLDVHILAVIEEGTLQE